MRPTESVSANLTWRYEPIEKMRSVILPSRLPACRKASVFQSTGCGGENKLRDGSKRGKEAAAPFRHRPKHSRGGVGAGPMTATSRCPPQTGIGGMILPPAQGRFTAVNRLEIGSWSESISGWAGPPA